MKRLNLNNAIAPTAMLTKTNTMNNKINFFAKVVMLVVMMVMLVPNKAKGEIANWQNKNGKWYVYYSKVEITSKSYDGKEDQKYIYTPYITTSNIFNNPNSRVTFHLNGGTFNTKFYFYLYAADATILKQYTEKDNSSWTRYKTFDQFYLVQNIQPRGLNLVKHGWEGSSNQQLKSSDVKIELPVHCDVSTSSLSFDAIEVGGTSSATIKIESFLTPNIANTPGVTITSSDPVHFRLSGMDANGVATICGEQNQAFGPYIDSGAEINSEPKVFFTASAPDTYSATITVKNGTDVVATYNVSATCNKRTPVFEWTDQTIISSQTHDQILNPVSISGYNGNITLSTSDPNIIRIDNGNTLVAVGNGTADITASINETNIFHAGSNVVTFTSTSKKIQVIDWTQSITAVQGSGSIQLNGVAKDRDTGVNTGCTITYSSDNTSVANINGTTMSFGNTGVAMITATAQSNGSYHETSITRKARVLSSSGCNSKIRDNISISQVDVISFDGKTASSITFSNHWSYGKASDVSVNKVLSNGEWVEIYSKEHKRNGSSGNDVAVTRTLEDDVIGIVFYGDGIGSDGDYLYDLTIYQASFLRPTSTTTFSFDEVSIGGERQDIIPATKYSNLRDVMTLSITGNDADQFYLSSDEYGNGCEDFSTANIKVTYRPNEGSTRQNPHTATLNVSGILDDGSTLTIPVQLSGVGIKQAQTITWNDQPELTGLTATTTKPDNTQHTNRLSLSATTDAQDAGGNMLPIRYTSSNPTIANVVPGTNQLEIYKQGIVTITADQPGNDVYEASQNSVSKELVISHAAPNLTWHSRLNKNTPVFSVQTLDAITTDNEGAISYSYTGDDPSLLSGSSLTIKNCNPLTVTATKAETDVYGSTSISYSFTPAKVTPVLQCSVASLTKTALTNLYLTEMPVTITNSTTLWHDIAVTYSSSDPTIAALDGDHFRLLKSGTCTITAEIVEDVNNNASSNKIQIPLTVDKANQTIEWNLSEGEQATHYSGDSFTLTATCPANDITYTSSNDNIATVSDGVLIFHNAGTVTITAHSDGDDIYYAAIDVPKTFSAALSNFPDTYIGQASTSQSIDLSNLSGAMSLTLSSSNPTVFRAFTNNEASANTSLNNSLNISEATTVNVKFYPESVGEATGTITITGDNGESIAIPVKGKGVQQSVTFGSNDTKIPRGTIESRAISLTNMVSAAGYTVTSNGVPFIVSQPQSGEFSIAFLPQSNTDFLNYFVTIHDNAFGNVTAHDYKINVEGHADAIETVDFGSVNARSTSSISKTITLSGVANIPGLMIASDENTSYLIDNNSSALAATDGQHTVSFTPFHFGAYNGKNVYLYRAENPENKYPLLVCNGVGNQVDLSSEINWVNTTISTLENTTDMAVINNATYASYVRLYYTNTGTFYDYINHPTDLEIGKTEIYAPSAGTSTVTAHVEALDGSNDFTGESSAEITATDKPIQKISYSSDIYYVVLNEDVEVDVYAYDSKNPSTRIDADFTMTCADSKVTITKGNYDNTNYVQQFTIHGAAAGSTTVSITSTPKGTSSGYESATETGIPVMILPNGNNCIVSVLADPSDNTFNTSGEGGSKPFNLTRAPCRSFKATLNYSFGTPTLNISDGTNTLVDTTYESSVWAWDTKTKNITYKYKAGSKHKPTILTVRLTGSTIGGRLEGSKDLTITEFSQLSYFDVISNHPNGSEIDFRNVTVGSTSVNETIKVDYSALHKAVELSLTDETNFTIVNKAEVLGKITECRQWGPMDIIVKYNPTVADKHTATLTIKGYTTDDNNNESIKTYIYTLKGQSSKRTQIISWATQNRYSVVDLGTERTLQLDASSNQPVYGSTDPMPITYTLDNDGGGVATLADGVLTISKAGTITVTAHQAGDDYTERATDCPLTITFTLEPQHIVWRNEDWSGNKDSNEKTIFTNASTSAGYELKILVQDSHGNDLSHDPDFIIEYVENCSGGTDLIRIEKNTGDNKFYAYYNNQGIGKVKITATHPGNESYSPIMSEDDKKSMYLIIEKETPIVTYTEEQLSSLTDVCVGDKIEALTRPTTTIDYPTAVFDYEASQSSTFNTSTSEFVTLTKSQDNNTTSLEAIHATNNGEIIYIHAKQQSNQCYNDEASSQNYYSFTVKKTPIAIEWNQTLDLSTGQYGEGGKVYQLDGKVKDTRHDKIIDNLEITYSRVISNKECDNIADNQIAKIDGNILYVYGTTSATLTITATQNGTTVDGHTDYTGAKPVTLTFDIQKITPTISFEPQATMVYGDKVAVTATSAVEGLYQSQADDNNRISISSDNTNAINITNDGYMEAKSVAESVTLTASQEDNCMVSGVQSVPKYVAVSLAPQKMVWNGVSSTNIDVAGTQTFTFNPYAIDKLHTNQNGTWLTLTNGEYYRTGNDVVYEIGNVTLCENSTETDLVSVDATTGVIRATGKGTGTVRIWAKANADSRYAEITDDRDKVYVDVTVMEVKPAIQSFDISSLDDIHYGDRVKLSSPTTSYFVNQGDNKTTFSYAGNAAYDISAIGTDTMFDAKAAGTGYTIVATQEAIACFNQASDASTSDMFNIAKSEQEIEWDQSPLSINGVSNDYQMDGISLTAKAMDKRHKAGGSQTWLTNLETGLPVTYTFTDVTVEKCGSDVDIINIDENGKLTATGLGSGTVTITATQADGNENYSGITADEDKKSITVTVNKITPDLKIYGTEGSSLNGETLNVYYGDPEYTALACKVMFAGTNNELKDATGNTLYSIDDIILTDDGQGVVTINGNGISFNKAGVATITATLKADCRVSQDVTASFYINVQKPDQTIKYTAIDDVNTGQYANSIVIDLNNHFTAYDESHTKATGGTIVYEVTINQDEGCSGITFDYDHTITIDGTGSGSVSIKATQDGTDASGNMNYNSAEITKSFNVNKITPTVTLDAITETIHFGDMITLHATASGTDYADDSDNNGTKIKFKYNGDVKDGNTIEVNDADGKFTVQAYMVADCQINSTASAVAEYDIALTDQEIVWNQSDMESSYTTLNKNQFTLNAYAIDALHNTTEIKTGAEIVYDFVLEPDDNNCGDIATLSNGVLILTGAGSGTVTIKATAQGVDDKYSAVTTPVEKTLTITKVDPVVTMETIANVTCGETGTLGAIANHGGNEGFTFESSNTDTATVSGNTFTALHAGTVRFRVTKAATCTTNGQTSDYVVATIDKADQTVTWNNSESETLLATDMTNGITLSATAKSNVTNQATNTEISYSITAGENLVKIENGKLVSLGAGTGTVTIKATAGTTFNGYEDYNEASQEITFVVVPDNITFTITKLELTYGDEDMAFNVTNDKGLTEGQYTMTITNFDNTYLRANAGNANHIDAIHAHSEDIEVGLKFSGMTNYADVETTAVVTVAKCPVEIVWDQDLSNQTTISHTTGYTLTATIKDTKHNKNLPSEVAATFGLTETDTESDCTPIAEISNNVLSVTGNGAGTVTVTASYAESDNFLDATDVEKSFTITKAVPQFNWAVAGDLNATYGDNNVTATTTHDGTGTVTYGSSDENVATIDGDGAITLLKQGETTIYADLAQTCQYEGEKITKKLTVGRKGRTLNWSTPPTDMTYGTTQTVEATPSKGDGTITYSINDNTHATINSSTGEITAIGVTTMPITVTATISQTEQYEEASETGTFNITPAKAIFVWGDGWSSTVAREMDYQASETLSVVCQTEGYSGYSVTYSVADGDEQYVSITDDVVTVTEVKGTGNVTVTATIRDNNGNYSNVDLTTQIQTNKIEVPTETFSFSDVTLTYNEAGENLDGHIYCAETGMPFTISGYTISQSDGTTYVSLGSDNKTLSPMSATNGATVTVTAHITGMTNYNDCDVTGNVTVAKGTQTITWDESKDYTVSNIKGSINLSDYCTLNVGDGNISFASSDPTVAEVSENNLVIKQITTERTVIITATAAGTDNYIEAIKSQMFTVTVVQPTITVNGGGTESVPLDLSATEPKITSVTNNVDLAAKLVADRVLTCNYQNVTYTFVSDNTDIATFAESDKRTIISYKRSDALKLTVTAKVDENHQCSTELWVKIPRGTMIFNRDGNWHDILNDGSNWQRRDLLPSADDHNVSIQANCTIDADVPSLPDDDNVSMQVKSTFDNITIAECYNLDIAENGSLTVDANDVLKVEGTFTNSNASKLKLEADASHSATVLFDDGSPSATVESYIKGGLNSEGEGKPNNPDWQYRGFVGNNITLIEPWEVVIFKWNENTNASSCWGETPYYNRSGNPEFNPWVGYCMADYNSEQNKKAYQYTSELIPTTLEQSSEYILSRTETGTGAAAAPNCGVNLITNSWSAPIDMSNVNAVTFEGDDERTFYFYETRSHLEWQKHKEKSILTYPTETGNVVNECSSLIPSGQSFLVKTKVNGRKLTINNGAFAIQSSGAMHAPAEKERFNVLSITMTIDSTADKLFLLEAENCSNAFDNGYDGTKIKESNTPQIFATNDFGYTAVNTDKTMLGQKIGYSAAEDGALCTITFNTDRLDGFSELYLYDRVAKRYANILAGDSYSFAGTKEGEKERFEIVGRRDDGSDFVTSGDRMIEVIGNRALLSGFAGGNDEVFITDMNGKRLWTERASNGPWFELPNLPAGVYLINCGEANCKFIVK